MINVDTAWNNFINNAPQENLQKLKRSTPPAKSDILPKCTDIYISTKTKLAYLNQEIDLSQVFWKIPILTYETEAQGVIKKQMKINCLSPLEVQTLEKKIEEESSRGLCLQIDILKQLKETKKIKFKDTRKINIGLCKKDLNSFRKKKKGAFYNCFVLIIRIQLHGKYKEIHVKIFNTGKLEIPGIHDDDILDITLDVLIDILQPFHTEELKIKEGSIQNVLINSNFSCNYFINRDKLYSMLKYKYGINVIYDSCSYPGVQCKFYYNKLNKANNGTCHCNAKCSKKGSGDGDGQCKEISFMIFRTGSVLIVGNCCEKVLKIIYSFLKRLFITEYQEIITEYNSKVQVKKKKRVRKKKILVSK